MVVHKNIYDYRNFKYLNTDIDYPTSEMIDDMNSYWDWVAQEPKLKSYATIAPILHDAWFKTIDRRGDTLTIKFLSYSDQGGIVKLIFHGVKDYRTYKTNELGKLTRKDVAFWSFAYDDIVIKDRIQYTFAAWQKDWRCQNSYICGIIECDSIEAVNG